MRRGGLVDRSSNESALPANSEQFINSLSETLKQTILPALKEMLDKRFEEEWMKRCEKQESPYLRGSDSVASSLTTSQAAISPSLCDQESIIDKDWTTTSLGVRQQARLENGDAYFAQLAEDEAPFLLTLR